MKALICLLLGHEPKLYTKNEKSFVWRGVQQWDTIIYEVCKRCGKMRSPISDKFTSI